MSRILAIDYGLKRTGLAVTDPLKIIATPLDTIPTHKVLNYLQEYFKQEDVDTIVLGLPMNLNNTETDVTRAVYDFRGKLQQNFSTKAIHLHDEKFTSKMALDAMIAGGTKKKDRRKKENLDKVSATIILQSYLLSINS